MNPETISKLIAAVECSRALDMPTNEGYTVLAKYGWTAADRFEYPATKFVTKLQDVALEAVKNDKEPKP